MTTAHDLHQKAYAQGHHAGLNGLPTSRADWEVEFLQSYLDGIRDGRAEKARGEAR